MIKGYTNKKKRQLDLFYLFLITEDVCLIHDVVVSFRVDILVGTHHSLFIGLFVLDQLL